MTNVLSSEARKEIWKFHRGRFVLAGSLIVLTGALFALLALLPGVLAIRAQQAAISDTARVTLPAGSEDDDGRAEVLRAHALVTQFLPVSSSTAPALEAILAALQARPSGASIDDIRYTTENGNKILINGVAASRTSISAYREALAKDPHFSSVSVPPGALVGTEGGRFSITLEGAF